MKSILFAVMTILVGGEAVAQTPLPRCPLESAVSKVLSKLEINIIFKQAYLSEEWRQKLKDADLADSMACLAENNALLDLARFTTESSDAGATR